MGKCQDTYNRTKTYYFPRATIRVHFPDITEEENARRMKQVHKAAADLLKASMKLKGVS